MPTLCLVVSQVHVVTNSDFQITLRVNNIKVILSKPTESFGCFYLIPYKISREIINQDKSLFNNICFVRIDLTEDNISGLTMINLEKYVNLSEINTEEIYIPVKGFDNVYISLGLSVITDDHQEPTNFCQFEESNEDLIIYENFSETESINEEERSMIEKKFDPNDEIYLKVPSGRKHKKKIGSAISKEGCFLTENNHICTLGGNPKNMWHDAPPLSVTDDRFDPHTDQILISEGGCKCTKKKGTTISSDGLFISEEGKIHILNDRSNFFALDVNSKYDPYSENKINGSGFRIHFKKEGTKITKNGFFLTRNYHVCRRRNDSKFEIGFRSIQ